jgi:hypothetical protein
MSGSVTKGHPGQLVTDTRHREDFAVMQTTHQRGASAMC